jgi:CRP-like cAMP-binding protein
MRGIEQLIRTDPEFALAWARVLTEEVVRVRDALLHFGAHSASTRLARFLIDSALDSKSRSPAECALSVELTHAEIASSLAMAHETTTRLLGTLEEKHVLRLGRGRIEIIDLDHLSALAGHADLIDDSLRVH